MSTRANIIRKNLDESFDLIYTHHDGYPSHHAPILLECYSYGSIVGSLLALGNLSVLKSDLSFCRPLEPAIGMQHFDDAGGLKAYPRQSEKR